MTTELAATPIDDSPPADPGTGELVHLRDEVLSSPGTRNLIEAIAKQGGLTRDELTDVILDGWQRGQRPLRALLDVVPWERLVQASNKHAGYQFRNPDPGQVDTAAFDLVPTNDMRRCLAVPVGFDDDGRVMVAIHDPHDYDAVDLVRGALDGREIAWYVADPSTINATISAVESKASMGTDEAKVVIVDDGGLLKAESAADGPIVSLVDNIIQGAIALNASDIHLEPRDEGMRLQYRRDGVLIERDMFSNERGQQVVNRFKTACQMPMQKFQPSDGRMRLQVATTKYDLRVATCPTIQEMESITIRLLATQQNLLDLEKLFPPAFLDEWNELIHRPDGLLLVVGRTGDGKPVSVDALVLMADGSRKRLGDVNVGDRVITHEGRARTVTAVHEQGRLPGITIETVHGRVTTAALDHPFLTPDGWVEAGELTPGMHLANVVRPSIEPTSERSDAEFVLAGLMVGDGNCTGYGATWHDRKQRYQHRFLNAAFTGDEEVAKEMFKACDELGFRYRKVDQRRTVNQYSLSGGVREWLRDVGLAGKSSHEKRVPDFVYHGTDEQVALFLGAYLACDGTVKMHQGHPDGPRLKGLDYYSSNHDLLVDVQHLLLRLGVQSFLSRKNAKGGTNFTAGEPYSSWRLFIGHEKDACARLAAVVPIPGVKGRLLAQYARPRSVFDEKLITDEISIVTRVDDVECRCLTVDEDHTFTVDDLVVHNSTTLAATLNRIAQPGVKTMTVEDPVEYRIPAVNTQVEVNTKAGRGFPEVLRSFLRKDPDIIMVGEIRDAETGEIAVQAAQTGHRVLSTLHVRDVCSAPARLGYLGVHRQNVAETLIGVLSQRLVRRLCTECREPVEYTKEYLESKRFRVPEGMALGDQRFYAANPDGCGVCKGTGYDGRLAVPELLTVREEISEMIARDEPAFAIRRKAQEEFGMESMRQMGFLYVAQGLTTLSEIDRVIQ